MSAADRDFEQKVLSDYHSFENFVIQGLDDRRVLSYYHFIPQVNFIRGYQGKLITDFIGRFESLETDFYSVCEKIGSDSQLKNKNRNASKPEKSYTKAYSQEMIDKVSQVYRQDVENLKYSFGT